MKRAGEPKPGQVAFQGLTRLVRTIERLHANGEVARRSGVTLERALHPVIFTIGDRGVARINDLASDLGLEASTVSRHVTKLVDRGLALRTVDTDDRRAIAVRLSKEGARVHRQLSDAWQSMLADALSVAGINDDRFGSDFLSMANGMATFITLAPTDVSAVTGAQPAGGRRAPIRAR